MEPKEYGIGDVVEMKKPHPCGTNAWKIIRLGADIRIKCTGCQHSVMIPRREFEKKMKKVLERTEAGEVWAIPPFLPIIIEFPGMEWDCLVVLV